MNPYIEQLLEFEGFLIDREITELQAQKSALDIRLDNLTEQRAIVLGAGVLKADIAGRDL